MEKTGKIIASIENCGISQISGKQWKVAQYVLETQETPPRHVMFEVCGEQKVNQFHIKVNDVITVNLDVDAILHNGRWQNQLFAVNVIRTPIPPPPICPSCLSAESADDLPF